LDVRHGGHSPRPFGPQSVAMAGENNASLLHVQPEAGAPRFRSVRRAPEPSRASPRSAPR
jgi:hypothetical protein